MTRLHPDLDDHDDLEELSRRLHDLADRWEVAPPAERPDLASRRSSRLPAWVPGWFGGSLVPVLAGLAIVALAVAASVWLSTLSGAPDVVERDGASSGPAGLLDEVPAEAVGDGPFVVTLGDVAAATDLVGRQRPDESSSPDEVLDWASAITGFDRAAGEDAAGSDVAYVELPAEWLDVQGWDDQLGWSLVDVDSFIDVHGSVSLGTAGNAALGDGLTVVRGPAAQVAYPDDVTDVGDEVVRAGTTECALEDSAPPVRTQGCPLYLARGDAGLLLASQPEQVDAWRDDEAPTLADDDDVTTVVDALGGGWTTAQVLRNDFSMDASTQMPATADQVLPVRFDLVALSWARDDSGPLVTVAYLHPDAEHADLNAAELERVWSGRTIDGSGSLADQVSVEDVTTQGRLAVVRLRPLTDQDNSAAFSQTSGGAPFLHTGLTSADPDLPPVGGTSLAFEAWLAGIPQGGGMAFLAEEVDPRPISRGDHVENSPVTISYDEPVDVVLHASCRGTGTLTIDFGSSTVEPSQPFSCDGSTTTIERRLPAGGVDVGLVAADDGTTLTDAWLADVEDS